MKEIERETGLFFSVSVEWIKMHMIFAFWKLDREKNQLPPIPSRAVGFDQSQLHNPSNTSN